MPPCRPYGGEGELLLENRENGESLASGRSPTLMHDYTARFMNESGNDSGRVVEGGKAKGSEKGEIDAETTGWLWDQTEENRGREEWTGEKGSIRMRGHSGRDNVPGEKVEGGKGEGVGEGVRMERQEGSMLLVEEKQSKEEMKGIGRAGSNGPRTAQDRMSAKDLIFDPSFQVYMAIHVLAVVTVAVVPLSRGVLLLSLASYALRMFGITGGYHRLLSHRSFKTSRVGQFLLALLGCSAFQKGPLWWASHHRHHHRTADTEEDVHSPVQWGFFWSHVGWFLCTKRNADILWSKIPDLTTFPELVLLDRFHFVPPFLLALLLFLWGGAQAAGWAFLVSTVLCWHATYCINSLAHLVGSRRFRCEFNTFCDARNNLFLAIVTLGEGWHNNHHCYMRSAKHGFYNHEIDVTWYILCLLSRLRLVWGLELPPMHELEAERFDLAHLKCRCEKAEEDVRALVSPAGDS